MGLVSIPEHAASTPPTVAGYPVGFKPPMLGLIAARMKLLDMRLATDPDTRHLRAGDVVAGMESPHKRSPAFSVRYRVTSVRVFDSVREAYTYYLSIGKEHLLFPPDHCLVKGQPVNDARSAEAYYRSMFQRKEWTDAANRVRVFSVGVEPGRPLPPYLLTNACRQGRDPRPPQPLPSQWSHAAPSPAPQPLSVRSAVASAPAPVSRLRGVAPPPIPRGGSARRGGGAPARLQKQLPLSPGVAAVVDSVPGDDDVVEKVIAEARRRARTRGSQSVTFRDLRDASEVFGRSGKPPPKEFLDIPEHIDEVVESLAALRAATLQLSGGGVPPPRVLVTGERSAVVARMFKKAGCDVATCDLQPSEAAEDEGIPHFQGDASLIQDLGWDLVIAHPPCTYLANVSGRYLYSDPSRWSLVLDNAAVFRRMYSARAPFVAVENSKMHRFAKDLVGGISPTCYVHPWQHGTGHTKPQGLYLRNLPAIRPTCIVSGREHATVRLPPSPERAEIRSRTYAGIAAAMAMQWVPVLLDYVGRTAVGRSTSTASEMVQRASCDGLKRHVRVAFTRRSADIEVVAHYDPAGTVTLPSAEYDDQTTEGQAASLLAGRLMLVPCSWRAEFRRAIVHLPLGHSTLHLVDKATGAQSLTSLWVIDVTDLGGEGAMPMICDPDLALADQPGGTPNLRWVPLPSLSQEPGLPIATEICKVSRKQSN